MSRKHINWRRIGGLSALLIGSTLAIALSALPARAQTQPRAEVYADAGFQGLFQGPVISRAMHEEAVRRSSAVLTHRQFRIDLDWGLPQ